MEREGKRGRFVGFELPSMGTSDPGQKKTPVLSPFLAAVTHTCI